MKHLALVATVALGWAALTAPANAALFSWGIEYTGWWEDDGGGSILVPSSLMKTMRLTALCRLMS
jgi:hypothetical protein